MHDSWSSLVAAVHTRFDATLPGILSRCREKGGVVYCTAGCSGCCTLNVAATLAEAAVIATCLSPGQEKELEDHPRKLARVLEGCPSFKEYLRRHRDEVGPCPFLGADRNCRIYPFRPLACRALFSTRNKAWCSVDFTTLHAGERQAFISGLDPELVAYPSHYLAAPQDLARDLELELEGAVIARYGFSLGGNLPLLVHLCLELGLPSAPLPPLARFKEILAAKGLAHPFVVTLTD